MLLRKACGAALDYGITGAGCLRGALSSINQGRLIVCAYGHSSPS